MSDNPFPGPRPYGKLDRKHFRGREKDVKRLASAILAQRSVNVFGPSGSGKSSLMNAGVIPLLEDEQDARVVALDTWPENEPLLQWFALALYEQLELGALPSDIAANEACLLAIKRAERRSDRPIVICLDQLEQLLYSHRVRAGLDAFVKTLDELMGLPVAGLSLVLSLREDYLGPLRAVVGARRRLIDYGFRISRLKIGEFAQSACKAAGEQHWKEEGIAQLLLQVGASGPAKSLEEEVEAAYAQIVCRELWRMRDAGGGLEEAIDAQLILRQSFESAVNKLGPFAAHARWLLEEEFVDETGSRTVRTETELHGKLQPDALTAVLNGLLSDVVLKAQRHQQTRFFEIGHDWLAKRVFEGKQERARLQAEESLRNELEQKKQQADNDARIRRRLVRLARALAVVIVVMVALVGELIRQKIKEKEALERDKKTQRLENAVAALAVRSLDMRDVDHRQSLLLARQAYLFTLRAQRTGGELLSMALYPQSPSPILELDGLVCALSADGRWFTNGKELWDVSAKPSSKRTLPNSDQGEPLAVGFSPDGSQLAVLQKWEMFEDQGLLRVIRTDTLEAIAFDGANDKWRMFPVPTKENCPNPTHIHWHPTEGMLTIRGGEAGKVSYCDVYTTRTSSRDSCDPAAKDCWRHGLRDADSCGGASPAWLTRTGTVVHWRKTDSANLHPFERHVLLPLVKSPKDESQTLAALGNSASGKVVFASKVSSEKWVMGTVAPTTGQSSVIEVPSKDVRPLALAASGDDTAAAVSSDRRVWLRQGPTWTELRPADARPIEHERHAHVRFNSTGKLLAAVIDGRAFLWRLRDQGADAVPIPDSALTVEGEVDAGVFGRLENEVGFADDHTLVAFVRKSPVKQAIGTMIRTWRENPTGAFVRDKKDILYFYQSIPPSFATFFQPQEAVMFAMEQNGSVHEKESGELWSKVPIAAARRERGVEQVSFFSDRVAPAPVPIPVVSPDGKWLAVCNKKDVELYRVDQLGTEPFRMTYPAKIQTVAFSADGMTLVTVLADKLVLVRPTPETVADRICEDAQKNLSEEDWDSFVGPDMPYECTCPKLLVPSPYGDHECRPRASAP